MRCCAFEQALERLCRYITRPALANEREQTNAAGQVVLKLKTASRDGTSHLVMSPLEFMQRLAALVARPRLHLIRFNGVLALNAKRLAQVVPQEPDSPAQAAPPAECEATCAHHRQVRLSWGKLLKRVFEIDLGQEEAMDYYGLKQIVDDVAATLQLGGGTKLNEFRTRDSR